MAEQPTLPRNATPEQVDTYLASVEYALTVTLRAPIELGGATYSELKLREPTAAEWTLWDKLTGVEADIKAVSVVSGVPEGIVRQIGTRDLAKAAGFIVLFLG